MPICKDLQTQKSKAAELLFFFPIDWVCVNNASTCMSFRALRVPCGRGPLMGSAWRDLIVAPRPCPTRGPPASSCGPVPYGVGSGPQPPIRRRCDTEPPAMHAPLDTEVERPEQRPALVSTDLRRIGSTYVAHGSSLCIRDIVDSLKRS